MTGKSLWCGCCGAWDSVDGFDTAFKKVSSHVAVCGTIAGAYLIAVPNRTCITVAGIQILHTVSHISMG